MVEPLRLEILVEEGLGAVAVLVLAQEHGESCLRLDAKAFVELMLDSQYKCSEEILQPCVAGSTL